jgi:cytochrome c oxidase subunit 2
MLSEGGAADFRLLDVDNRVVTPVEIKIRVVVSAADVIHSWTVPAMGVRVDAVPGRLNQTVMTPCHRGVFYGQCSEICGANHSFMPIVLEAVEARDFVKWVKTL